MTKLYNDLKGVLCCPRMHQNGQRLITLATYANALHCDACNI